MTLSESIAKSVASVNAMSPIEREAMYDAQRRSWMRGELAFGSDSDESRYRAAGDAERECLNSWMSARADWIMQHTLTPYQAGYRAGEDRMKGKAAFLVHKMSQFPDEYRQSRCDEILELPFDDLNTHINA